eukprot:11665508-Alexandrium_andersonii.AAC.1
MCIRDSSSSAPLYSFSLRPLSASQALRPKGNQPSGHRNRDHKRTQGQQANKSPSCPSTAVECASVGAISQRRSQLALSGSALQGSLCRLVRRQIVG